MSALNEVLEEINEPENTETVETNHVEEEHKEDEPKVNLDEISKEDKITHSFKQQLNRQKNKYEAQIAEQKKAFESLQSRLEKLENPEKYRVKLRNDFENDDKYIDYLVEQRMNKMFAERDSESQKQKEIDNYRQEQANAINERISKCFPTEEERKNYLITVQQAFDKGLEQLIDNEKYVCQYIQKSENGPRLLYDLATKPELTQRVFSQADSMSRIMELKLHERDYLKQNEIKNGSPVINTAKVIGKPGVSTNRTTDLFSNNDDLKNFIRRR